MTSGAIRRCSTRQFSRFAGSNSHSFLAHGATPAYTLPFDGDEIRGRVTTGVGSHRLRGYMLNAYHSAGCQAVSDSATGLFSGKCFRQRLQTLVDEAVRWDKSLSLNVISVPEFDQIRNEYGDTAVARIELWGYTLGHESHDRVRHNLPLVLRREASFRTGSR